MCIRDSGGYSASKPTVKVVVPSAEEDAAPADEADVFAVSAEPQPASRADAQKAAVKMLTIFFFIIIFSFST